MAALAAAASINPPRSTTVALASTGPLTVTTVALRMATACGVSAQTPRQDMDHPISSAGTLIAIVSRSVSVVCTQPPRIKIYLQKRDFPLLKQCCKLFATAKAWELSPQRFDHSTVSLRR